MNEIEQLEVSVDKLLSGWLGPDGTFYECNWGEHTDVASEIIKIN